MSTCRCINFVVEMLYTYRSTLSSSENESLVAMVGDNYGVVFKLVWKSKRIEEMEDSCQCKLSEKLIADGRLNVLEGQLSQPFFRLKFGLDLDIESEKEKNIKTRKVKCWKGNGGGIYTSNYFKCQYKKSTTIQVHVCMLISKNAANSIGCMWNLCN